jgi:TolB protein
MRAIVVLAMMLVGCRDRATKVSPTPPPTPAPAPAPAVLDLSFVRGDVVVGEERDGHERPLRLDPATATWVALGSGEAHLFSTGFRLGDGLLCIATVGDTEADHVEQLAIVRGAEVSRLGPTATMIRNPSVVGDTVVFESSRESFRDLYAVTAAGAVRRLTDDAAGNFEPALSPDGAQVAFASSRDGDAELYVQPLAGGAARRLTASGRDDWSPRWSPDGAALAFLSDRDGSARIYTVAAAGGDARRLSSDPGAAVEDQPRWSPDGRRLAFVRTEAGRGTVVLAEVATRRVRTLTPDTAADLAVEWSPDGAAVVVLRKRGRATAATFVRVADAAELGAVPTTATYLRWMP